jgi:hypothetical protein
MSRSIELSDEDYAHLERAAEMERVTPAEWVARRIPHWRTEPLTCADGTPARTMADVLAGRVGVIASAGKERLSERASEMFGEMLEEQRSAERCGDPGADACHVLEVPDPLYTAIADEAQTRGLTPLAWIAAQLPKPKSSPAPNGAKPRTMAERLAGRIGLFSGSNGLPSSDNVAQSFAEHLEAKQRAGRL